VVWVWDEVSVALDRAHKESSYPLVSEMVPGTRRADQPSFLLQYQGVGDAFLCFRYPNRISSHNRPS